MRYMSTPGSDTGGALEPFREANVTIVFTILLKVILGFDACFLEARQTLTFAKVTTAGLRHTFKLVT
jgi:hypothetical protein